MRGPRHTRFWTAEHNNGWRTWVAERENGLYVAGISMGPVPYVETRYRQEYELAVMAAAYLLRYVTGHECGEGCAKWRLERSGDAPLGTPFPE